MTVLLAETNQVLPAFIAFVVIMCIVGFFLMRADKKRWLLQVARSEEMERARKGKKKKKAEAGEGENQDAEAEETKGKKKKKEKKIPEGFVDGRTVQSDAYQYKGLISDKVLFFFAICFGALGELLGMIVYKHRWYKWSFRVFIPSCVVLNILMGILIGLLLSAKGSDAILTNDTQICVWKNLLLPFYTTLITH